MAHLSQFSQQDIYELLNYEKIDASNGVLLGGAQTMQPDDTNRFILIGIGGTGVSTINKVKGVISKRMDHTWRNYIAFLALDTDWLDLRAAENLSQSEKFMYSQEHATMRYENRMTYPSAAHQFMPDGYPDPNAAVPLGNLNARGANQERLVGKAKIHDNAAGAAMGVDEQIVHRLRKISANMLPIVDCGHYEVYVVGSGCGGTGGGAFADMPALIREAIPNARIYSMLYLPDTLSGSVPPAIHNRLKANGYATLKEINYYQGMEMRGKDYPARWGYNGPQGELVLCDKFYDIPYLVGGPEAGATTHAYWGAKRTIVEFLVDLMTKKGYGPNFMSDSLLANASARANWDARPVNPYNSDEEAWNTYHNFPKSFASLGFARTAIPEDLVRAYQAKLICETAGIKPLPKEEWQQQPADRHSFRNPENTMNFVESENCIRDILRPLERLLDEIHLVTFDYRALPGVAAMTFPQVLEDSDHPMLDRMSLGQIEQDKLNELKNKIENAYEQYEQNVREFVKAEGPYAFVNLYQGFYMPNGNQTPIGIHARLGELVNGRKLDGRPFLCMTMDEAKRRRMEARRLLHEAPVGMRAILFQGRQQEAVDAWIDANTQLGNAIIIEKRREFFLGDKGYITGRFVSRAAKLTNDLKAFGHLLTALSDTYSFHGRKMESYEAFRNTAGDSPLVNAAAVSEVGYGWLKNKAREAMETVNLRAFRDSLVDHFFGRDDRNNPNRALWLDVPDQLFVRDNNQVRLLTRNGAIPGRKLFDELLAGRLPQVPNVSIQELFEILVAQGESYDAIAVRLVQELGVKSQPAIRTNSRKKSDTRMAGYLICPANLDAPIQTALHNAAMMLDPGIMCYACGDVYNIVFYRQETGLAAYMLADIEDWEHCYEMELARPMNRLHGKSPDTRRTIRDGRRYFRETIPWADYPPLSAQENPEKPDGETGQISREGLRRIRIRQTIEEARKLGVLYSEQDAAGKWTVYRVWCDDRNPEWKFNLMQLPLDDRGLFPQGKALAQAVADQNGRSLNSMSRAVRLEHAGLLSRTHSNEAVAWEYAARTLFENVQMYVEVLDTLKLFREWAKQIDALDQ